MIQQLAYDHLKNLQAYYMLMMIAEKQKYFCRECGTEMAEEKKGIIATIKCPECGNVLKDIHVACGGDVFLVPKGRYCNKCKRVLGASDANWDE